MKIDFSTKTHKNFFQNETDRALKWLYNIQDGIEENEVDTDKCGWAWVQFIRPNEQNTAEVISTFVDYIDWVIQKRENIKIPSLNDPLYRIIKPIRYWLIDTTHAQISIDYSWVMLALQKVRSCKYLIDFDGSQSPMVNLHEVQDAINICADWLIEHKKDADNSKVVGWGDNDQEVSGSIRTSLAIIALNREIEYLRKNSDAVHDIDERLKKYEDASAKGLEWLLHSQQSDGGWGNLRGKDVNREYEVNHNFSYEDMKYQTLSNPAATGYVICALMSTPNIKIKNTYLKKIRDAIIYLKKTQMDSGGWPVFTEVGIRDGSRYTFRHFSTTWALSGALLSGQTDFSDDFIVHGFSYLIGLQDENYGGWKCFPDSDCYTWSTCNALSTIALLKSQLSEIKNKEFLNIVWDWWSLKLKRTDHEVKIHNTEFAFNNQTALLFCVVFSIMITALLLLIISVISPFMSHLAETQRKFIYSVMIVFSGAILGLPWIVYVKNQFFEDSISWIDSVGWVYGIITGFVLVLYQFIL